MRALVIGGSGQIGGWLLKHLADRNHEAVGTYATVPQPGLIPLDAADLPAAQALIRHHKPEAVFYPAGFTWVDGCERDPAKAYSANCEQPLNVARATRDVGGRFVYFSTDYVFDGVAGPYDEQSPPHALSVYGQAKLQAEQALAAELGDHQLTLRTSWVFGPERQGKNFAYQLVRALSAGKEMTVPADQVSSPSYGPDVALAALTLLETGHSGLCHVVGPETIDRLTFAREIATAFGLDPARIDGKATAELGQGAPRPLNGGLLTPRLDTLAPRLMRPLKACLADFLQTLDNHKGWADPRT